MGAVLHALQLVVPLECVLKILSVCPNAVRRIGGILLALQPVTVDYVDAYLAQPSVSV